jgi:hypothetical protein
MATSVRLYAVSLAIELNLRVHPAGRKPTNGFVLPARVTVREPNELDHAAGIATGGGTGSACQAFRDNRSQVSPSRSRSVGTEITATARDQ